MLDNNFSENQLRSYLSSLQNEIKSSSCSVEIVSEFLRGPLDFFENKNWKGPFPNRQLHKYFLTKLYSKHLSFILENIISNWFEILTRSQQQMLVTEYFVPSGEKSLQKQTRACISLQVLVTHFSVSSQQNSHLEQRQQIYLLMIIKKFLVSLFNTYSISDFFDAILSNEDINLNERFPYWKEFVSLVCSIPERTANLMVLNQNQVYNSRSPEDDVLKGAIEVFVFAFGELFSKICRIGHSKILVQAIYHFLVRRLHPSVNRTYQDIWHRVTASFSPHMLESFITSLLLYAQNCDLSKVSTPVSMDDQSRHLIRKIAKILMLLTGNINNESILFLIKYKYFVGGKSFSVPILRVLCCFLCWRGLQKEANDDDNLNLKPLINDDLINVLKTLISSWSDPTFVKHGSITDQKYITSAILILFGYLPKETLIDAGITREIVSGVSRWLQNSSEESRKLGMITAETLSRLTDETGNVLDFELNSEDENVKYLRQLVEVKDGLLDLPDIENDDIEDQENTVSKSDQIVDFSEKYYNTEIPIDKNINSQPVDSDDDDEFEPYPMEEESENEEDDKCEPQTKKKKVLPPVYIIDLLSYLKSSDDLDKIEVAINTAAKLIRDKTGFGMELDDHADELARILINLRDTFELKKFDENRQAALIALVCGSPRITVPFIIQQFFETRYSLSDKLMILSALSSAAKELSGIRIEEIKDIPAKKEIPSIELTTQSTSDLGLISKNTLNGPTSDKVRWLSRRPKVEYARLNSTKKNRFNELAAKTFFSPLLAGFWICDQGEILYEPVLVHRYVVTLAIFVQCSINTVDLIQIDREYWDLLLSLRYNDDPTVLSALLFGINSILNSLSERELADDFGKELVETQQWINALLENQNNENIQPMAVWILAKIQGIVSNYQRLLLGDLLPLT
ncbi:13173_t:CDS:10 [Dentiscutata erythropus]|uniref:13173_t:CDS:1 n=1 Tax=Dentiscutata erythropus TaxID=1348616 RepID=A0A9N9H6I8_9GLOM|nr:13173_t:CDS:10 [Dentiscutata erythropus]